MISTFFLLQASHYEVPGVWVGGLQDGCDGADRLCSVTGIAFIAAHKNSIFVSMRPPGLSAVIKLVTPTTALQKLIRAVRRAAEAMGTLSSQTYHRQLPLFGSAPE